MEDWESEWEDEETGRSTFNILPRVSTQPCFWKREEILFFTGHGPFSSYFKRFNLASTANCPCGNKKGTPLHYATECILTTSQSIYLRECERDNSKTQQIRHIKFGLWP
ncbi:hypothetical protein AVEN_114347-1 [Araneus ventricosus]|uniref:Uncharacterized protein n=1 Tax=Araneus ventricosus TaxID=182803 RepID=A0A4Y2BYK4_ARAVE|nr:hypothetical protein AVEN_7035-1 [Araneus ventricosus]GBL96616.1 hypothetical protein AVEN_15779-1 [Araneus ventricosus]GBL96675.1 hypothetical protein AVEN_88868-1 [Araneus ventricosus]GBL96683.1 hypothetical protein AVEN_114347-1 [Araneus ventricosus]